VRVGGLAAGLSLKMDSALSMREHFRVQWQAMADSYAAELAMYEVSRGAGFRNAHVDELIAKRDRALEKVREFTDG